MTDLTILAGDARDCLRDLPAGSVHCCVTSPPYFGLRSYLPAAHPDKAREIGTEATPEEYVANLVDVFREVRRVLRDDGTLWLNLGDSYAGSRCGPQGHSDAMADRSIASQREKRSAEGNNRARQGAKPTELIGIPWMVAFALRTDGWYLRAENIWAKRNCMPESVTNRTTRAHEQVFMLTKSRKYFYDAKAIEEESTYKPGSREDVPRGGFSGKNIAQGKEAFRAIRETKNKRSVWSETTIPFSGRHFATMPPAIAEICIKAGTSEGGVCPECGMPSVRVLAPKVETGGSGNKERKASHNPKGNQSTNVPWKPTIQSTIGFRFTCKCGARPALPATVLDPFGGAGTTGLVAHRLGRKAILVELSQDFANMAAVRIRDDAGMFVTIGGQ